MPGQVEELTLTPFSHNISVNWKHPTVNDTYCVTRYVIYWVHNISGSIDSRIVGSEVYSFVIEDLDACVDYEVSVRAVNENNENRDAVTGNTRTRAVGNYQAQIMILYLCG